MKTIVVDGITCEMSDTAVEVVRRAMDKFTTDAAAAAKKFGESEADYQKRIKAGDEAVAKLTTEAATKDAQIATLTKQLEDSKLTPAKLDELVKDRQVVADKAKALLPAVVVDGKTVEDIMAQVVNDKLGEAAKGWSADQIKISFDTLTAGIKQVEDSGVARTARAFSTPSATQMQTKDAMYDKRDADLANAWKTPAGAA